jgi:hypothetical protein
MSRRGPSPFAHSEFRAIAEGFGARGGAQVKVPD